MELKSEIMQHDTCQTVLGAGCVIEGEIATRENVFVRGKLQGDLVTVGAVSVCGQVQGNVTCAEFTMDSGSLRGNLKCQGSARLSPDSALEGDVQAGELLLGGKLNGNAAVTNLTELSPTASMQGDLSAGRIKMADGALLCGRLQMCGQQ